MSGKRLQAANEGWSLALAPAGAGLHARLCDRVGDLVWSDAPYCFSLQVQTSEGQLDCRRLTAAAVEQAGETLSLSARLGDLTLRQAWTVPAAADWMEERVNLRNEGSEPVAVMAFECGFVRAIADTVGRLRAGCENECVAAVPFRKRPTDSPEWLNEHPLEDLLSRAGREPRCDADQHFGFLPSRHWCSEAWAWMRDEQVLVLMKFNQDAVEYSTLSTVVEPDGLSLRFGGACMHSRDGLPVCTLEPGATWEPGVMRYRILRGGWNEAAYAMRDFLDERGCRFPGGFNPPVHWNELYDNPEWWVTAPSERPAGHRIATRRRLYTRDAMHEEARKARDYHCESLYLDPGWDTTFGSFEWDAARLGSAREFVREMRQTYDLAVSLHTPLATWMSGRGGPEAWNTLAHWPPEARRMPRPGETAGPGEAARICLGSRQYRDEAEQRLLALCEAGVVYLMFDGNWWSGPCHDPAHGHPVPYTREDHIRANVDLAQRIHAVYPNVLIEMHDMLCGGAHPRMTPVYYKHGLPGSYDTNWGFELMWNPIEDLRNGRALALYYYNMACNVPLYLHIDLRDDNEHCTFFWWFASTCRHLGIGGTHADPHVAAAQRQAMRRYRHLDSLFKRGDFYGISEEAHVHVLPNENRLAVNIFNLTDRERRIRGTIPVERLGIACDRDYRRSERWCAFNGRAGTLDVNCPLPAWGHQLVELSAIE